MNTIKITNWTIYFFVVVVIAIGGLSLFSAPGIDECWRVLLVKEQIPSINSFSPLYFPFLRNSDMFTMRVVVFVISAITNIFLGCAIWFYSNTFYKVSPKYIPHFGLLPVVMIVAASPISFGPWGCNPDYINLTSWLVNLSIACALIVLTDIKHKRIILVLSFLGGVFSSQLFFSAPPSITVAFVLFGILVFKHKWKSLFAWCIGGGLGVLLFFIVIASPNELVSFIHNAASNTLASSDDHSIISIVIPWFFKTIKDIFKNSFYLAVPYALWTFRKSRITHLIICAAIAFFFLRFLKQMPIPILGRLPDTLIPPIFPYELAIALFLQHLLKSENGENLANNSQAIVILAIILLSAPIFSRLGTNVFFNLSCSGTLATMLVLTLILVFKPPIMTEVCRYALICALCFGVLSAFVLPPDVLRREKRASLSDFGEPRLFTSKQQYDKLKKLESLIDDKEYLVTGGNGWPYNYILKKKPFHLADYHYSQKMDIVMLMRNRHINISNAVFITYPGSWFSMDKIDKLFQSYPKTTKKAIQFDDCTVVFATPTSN